MDRGSSTSGEAGAIEHKEPSRNTLSFMHLCTHQLLCRIIFVALLFLSPGVYGSVPGGGPFPESRFAMVDSIRMHYRVFPATTDVPAGHVLLVHGFAGSTFSWRYVSDTLAAAGYHVVAVDMPPYGYSDKNPLLDQSFTARALLLEAFLEQGFPDTEWHLVGHSMGGAMVQALAIIRGDIVQSVTMVNGTLFSQLTPGETHLPWLLRGRLRREITLLLGRPVLLNRLTVRRLLGDAYGTKPDREAVEGYLKPLKVRGTARAILHAPNVSNERFHLSADSLNVPALAIWGDQDTWVPVTAYRSALERMPHVKLVMIEQAAHCPMETHPDQFLSYLLPFLQSNP